MSDFGLNRAFHAVANVSRDAFHGRYAVRLPALRYVALALILVIGAGLRFAWLWRDAPPLFADEFEQYVSVHNIITTGRDVDGTMKPFLYCRLGRNPPIYGMAGYLSTLVFGNTTFGWRFPAALFGLVSIGLVYLLVKELTKRDTVALLAALLLAIEPNHIHFSRIGWEPATVLPFLLAALWLSLVALRDRTRPLPFAILGAAAVLLGLCPYTYAATPLYAVLLVGSLFALHRGVFHDERNRRAFAVAGGIALAIATPGILIATTDPHTFARSVRIATFQHGFSGTSLQHFITNYGLHFSWRYLFANGSADPRYLCGYGVLHWWYAPLIALGALYAGRYVRSRPLCWWLWIWLAAYPLGGALTNDGVVPHAPRTIAGTPALCIFAAIGIYALLSQGRRFIREARLLRVYRLCALCAIAALAMNSVRSFSTYYFRIYPVVSARAWESGAREAFAAVRTRQSEYRRLCTSGLSYWHIQSLERYFLVDTPLTLLEGTRHAECSRPATLLLTTSVIRLPGFFVVNVSSGLDGSIFAVLEARPSQPKSASRRPMATDTGKPGNDRTNPSTRAVALKAFAGRSESPNSRRRPEHNS